MKEEKLRSSNKENEMRRKKQNMRREKIANHTPRESEIRGRWRVKRQAERAWVEVQVKVVHGGRDYMRSR